ncbi:MAG TPA: hypothetical protein VN934_10140 [Candidatus Tumulicola sp.]|nr:hypothetical protein [Candidatus Tumulicola sp.]
MSLGIGFNFGTVYVKDATLQSVRTALEELMAESERQPTTQRGLEPTPDTCIAAKRVRSFAIFPEEDGWIAVLEDGHAFDDGGIAEGLSEVLQTETLQLSYSDAEGHWSYTSYWEGQPLEAGGADDDDYDVGAAEFVRSRALPHFGVYYEEVAAAASASAPVLAGAEIAGSIRPRLPIGTEVVTFLRLGRPHPT